jgi:hypothetical protein
LKRGLGALLILGAVVAAAPAAAYVVEVTTSLAVPEADDDGAALIQAVRSAVDNVIRDTIALTPTLVVLTQVVVVGDRLYLRVLLADQEGERTLRDPAAPPDDGEPALGSSKVPL